MSSPIVLGYHGCDRQTAQMLLGGSSFLPSDKAYDWLGSGVYFWEWDMVRAYTWAKEKRSASPCVVGAAVELGNCLDLTTQFGIRAVKAAYESYIELQRQTNQPIPENKPAPSGRIEDMGLRFLDRAVMNHLHKSFAEAAVAEGGRSKEFDTVRALFPEGDPLYANSGFLGKTHVQIAVRDLRKILGVFRIPEHQLRLYGLPDLYTEVQT